MVYKFLNAKDIKCIITFLLNTDFEGIYFDGWGTKNFECVCSIFKI